MYRSISIQRFELILDYYKSSPSDAKPNPTPLCYPCFTALTCPFSSRFDWFIGFYYVMIFRNTNLVPRATVPLEKATARSPWPGPKLRLPKSYFLLCFSILLAIPANPMWLKGSRLWKEDCPYTYFCYFLYPCYIFFVCSNPAQPRRKVYTQLLLQRL